MGANDRRKVLVADDDRIFANLVVSMLREWGYEARVVRDAVQATMEFRRYQPDLVILDINMPGGSGLEVLRRLALRPSDTQVPVLAVSANRDAKLPEQARQSGATTFLPKPLEPALLQSTVSRLLGEQPVARLA